MKFTRTRLIETIDAALERDTQAQAARAEAEEKVRADNLTKWTAEEWPKWKAYRDELSRLIRRGNPIRHEDVPSTPATFRDDEDRYGNLRDGMNKARRAHPILGTDRRIELEAIKSTLEAILDDEVTDSQLGRLGFGASSISRIFRAATVEGA